MVVRSSKLAAIDLDRSRMRIGLVIVPDGSRGGGRAKRHVNVLEKPCPLLAKALPLRLTADESGVLRRIPRACGARWEGSPVKKSCSRAANLSRALSGRPAPISAWVRNAN